MTFNIPNSLSLLRIILIPIMIGLFFTNTENNRTIAAMLFSLAAITDYLDGYMARNLKQHTSFGEFIDPVADKLLVVVILMLLMSENNSIYFIIPSIIIITREFLVVSIRQRLAELGNKITIKVSYISKIKTAIQMTALFLLLYQKNTYGINIYDVGVVALQIASLLTLISFIIYVKKSWNGIINQH